MIQYIVTDAEGYVSVLSTSPCDGANPVEVPDDIDLSAISCYMEEDGVLVLDGAKLIVYYDEQAEASRREARLQRAAERLQTMQAASAAQTATILDDVIALAPLLPEWEAKGYKAGDVVQYGDAPYKCAQTHDAAGNPGWNPQAAPSLWAKYHAQSAEYALPWAQPTGAHDAYQKDEYMEFTDGSIYRCMANGTVHAPDVLASAWKKAG